MNKLERQQILIDAINTYGWESQQKMMVEEMSELTKAFCKYWRAKPASRERWDAVLNILEEIADVQIMLDQMKLMFGDAKESEIEKLSRLRERLSEV